MVLYVMELKQMGITVEDTPQGTRWLRESN